MRRKAEAEEEEEGAAAAAALEAGKALDDEVGRRKKRGPCLYAFVHPPTHPPVHIQLTRQPWIFTDEAEEEWKEDHAEEEEEEEEDRSSPLPSPYTPRPTSLQDVRRLTDCSLIPEVGVEGHFETLAEAVVRICKESPPTHPPSHSFTRQRIHPPTHLPTHREWKERPRVRRQ